MCRRWPSRFPTEILAERARLPEGFLDEVAHSMAYADAVAANAANLPGCEDSRMRQIATVIELELAAEEIAARHGR
jgi:hypothetical protein